MDIDSGRDLADLEKNLKQASFVGSLLADYNVQWTSPILINALQLYILNMHDFRPQAHLEII